MRQCLRRQSRLCVGLLKSVTLHGGLEGGMHALAIAGNLLSVSWKAQPITYKRPLKVPLSVDRAPHSQHIFKQLNSLQPFNLVHPST